MLVPQSLAYALLAGLPPEVGLYASIFPLILYALFGTSTTLSVGPVAITSLLTAAALSEVAAAGSADYLSAAITLAAMSGMMLTLAGIFRLGFLSNFLSHSVVSAFITASAILIVLSQLRHVFGIESHGESITELLGSLYVSLDQLNTDTMLVAVGVIIFLYVCKEYLANLLMKSGMTRKTSGLLARAAPVLAIIFSITLVVVLGLEDRGVAVVGTIPSGLPAIQLPAFSRELMEILLLPAFMISIIGYVESISVGKTLGNKRRERVDSNQELIGLGAANISSALSGGLPVTGGFSRSVVNFDAGAVTQAASIYTAILIALFSVLFTPLLYFLPKATLAATIIVAVSSLVDFSMIKKTYRVAPSDCMAVVATIVLTLFLGVGTGVTSGVLISLTLHVYRTSKPHIAAVGLVEGTEHFRNIKRYRVATCPQILTLRLDESLFFANVMRLEELILKRLYQRDHIGHVILMCTAINEIDYSALETLEVINHNLKEQGVMLHLSEVKGPVMDILQKTDFLEQLGGHVYLTQYQAYKDLC
jgi:sulfate permease, SulP family